MRAGPSSRSLVHNKSRSYLGKTRTVASLCCHAWRDRREDFFLAGRRIARPATAARRGAT
jgi:hypothetical protein